VAGGTGLGPMRCSYPSWRVAAARSYLADLSKNGASLGATSRTSQQEATMDLDGHASLMATTTATRLVVDWTIDPQAVIEACLDHGADPQGALRVVVPACCTASTGRETPGPASRARGANASFSPACAQPPVCTGSPPRWATRIRSAPSAMPSTRDASTRSSCSRAAGTSPAATHGPSCTAPSVSPASRCGGSPRGALRADGADWSSQAAIVRPAGPRLREAAPGKKPRTRVAKTSMICASSGSRSRPAATP
jgi:hypothetical protein